MTNIKNIYTSYEFFISSKNLKCLHHSHLILLTAFKLYILVKSYLDHFSKKKYSDFFCIIYY